MPLPADERKTMSCLKLNGQLFDAAPGMKLSDAILAHRALEMPCAGSGRCGKCRVRARGGLSELTETEKRFLTPGEIAGGIRLACCTFITGDAEVSLPDERQSQIRMSGIMPDFEKDPMFRGFGVAFDIGTTTLAAQLYGAGGLLAQASAPNPQSAFGADVISRIKEALSGRGEELSKSIRGAVNALIAEMCGSAAIDPAQVDAVVVTGNTAMLYLFTCTPPGCLSHAPFEADRLFGVTLPAKEFGLCCAGAQVYMPRCISAFVGADITCALLASGICLRSETALLADIGTNGEMALWHAGRLLCCSTAAGPAFEGAGISMGMGGKSGAVDRVSLEDGNLRVHTIDGAAPAGICGSGIVDAVSCLLLAGKMDETGILDEDPAVIAPPVEITQADIRAVQLAKSAMCAGMQTLLKLSGVSFAGVRHLFIAGGFGSYLDRHSAAVIGLIPAQLEEKAQAIGNAALSGAAMILQNRAFAAVSTVLAEKAETQDLTTSCVFTELYMENMLFGCGED